MQTLLAMPAMETTMGMAEMIILVAAASADTTTGLSLYTRGDGDGGDDDHSYDGEAFVAVGDTLGPSTIVEFFDDDNLDVADAHVEQSLVVDMHYVDKAIDVQPAGA